jgi:hypothetical protein
LTPLCQRRTICRILQTAASTQPGTPGAVRRKRPGR